MSRYDSDCDRSDVTMTIMMTIINDDDGDGDGGRRTIKQSTFDINNSTSA